MAVVATPIGNLGDISARAIATLREADRIACEDTRMTARLCRAHAIETPLTPYHEHNAERARPALLRLMAEGGRLALVSDAGTPLISDPGYRLTKACIEDNIPFTILPGPSAPLAALALSGLPTDRFLFAGFPPSKKSARKKWLAELTAIPATLIFFESAKRLASSLSDMMAVFGPREAAMAREITKLYEEVRRAPLDELATHFETQGPPKGEVVIVVAPPDAIAETGEDETDRLLIQAMENLSLRDAAEAVAKASGRPKRDVYARALALSGKQG
ncbi:MAG: 16S rRNA (cytidine(1402)-2'-O)-methyltransferase [Rhodospirillaceae bacterium]|nr:16S rRNA (cytidine(1402)-2'-O)-methyltransferase [Rhodospirillaceae bacterium]